MTRSVDSLRARVARRFLAIPGALLDLALPELCRQCGRGRGEARWTESGGPAAGLRPWDRPHLCADCAGALAPEPARRALVLASGRVLPVHAGRPTEGRLVRLVGDFKYHGVRGLAWPLAALAASALPAARAEGGAVDGLVAVPLHRRRRRARGFNQAAVLARLLAAAAGAPCREGIAVRRRATGQQARLARGPDRDRNVARAFSARAPREGEGRRLALVDDLVTSGATVCVLAEALLAAGWDVRWALAIGLGRGDGETRLDSIGGPS